MLHCEFGFGFGVGFFIEVGKLWGTINTVHFSTGPLLFIVAIFRKRDKAMIRMPRRRITDKTQMSLSEISQFADEAAEKSEGKPKRKAA